jgi:hypothetical protein
MIEPAKSVLANFRLQFLGHGKFIRPWRVPNERVTVFCRLLGGDKPDKPGPG